MPFFVVTYTHPHEEGWRRHLRPHLDWLVQAVESGFLRASGPCLGNPVRSAMLVVTAADHQAALDLVSTDPYVIEGQVGDMTVIEWDPIFGGLPQRVELRRSEHLTDRCHGREHMSVIGVDGRG